MYSQQQMCDLIAQNRNNIKDQHIRLAQAENHILRLKQETKDLRTLVERSKSYAGGNGNTPH